MNVSERVYAVLRQRLMSGHYDPGIQLKEEGVAADFGVSRTPVRAAIQRLVAEGLLEPAPKRGAVVTAWRRQDVEDIFNLRIMLEGYGAALAARRADVDAIDTMERLNDALAAAVRGGDDDRIDVITATNLAFHGAIYDHCGSAHLRTAGIGLLDYPMIMGGFFVYTQDDLELSVRQHGEIVAALRARSPEWARAAVMCHLTSAIERFRRAGQFADAAGASDSATLA